MQGKAVTCRVPQPQPICRQTKPMLELSATSCNNSMTAPCSVLPAGTASLFCSSCHLLAWPMRQVYSKRGMPAAAGPGGAFRTHTSSRDSSLQWIADPDSRRAVAKVVEAAEAAGKRWEIVWSDWLPPPLAADAMLALQNIAEVTAVPWGGYSQAERVRLALGREDLLSSQSMSPPSDALGGVAALEVKGNFLFDPASHPDFLGAILGTGVVREKVGDILVQGETGAQILVSPDLLEHFETSLTKVRTVPVTTRRIPLSALRVAEARTLHINSVEASLRLDAIASAGFRISRGKAADFVKGGDVRVNWKLASKPCIDVKQGDVISVSGMGRVHVQEIVMTKKDKYAVKMLRHV